MRYVDTFIALAPGALTLLAQPAAHADAVAEALATYQAQGAGRCDARAGRRAARVVGRIAAAEGRPEFPSRRKSWRAP